MAQCKARTAQGTQCRRNVAPPSRTLCKGHQEQLVRGKRVVNAGTGRAFLKPRRGQPEGADNTAAAAGSDSG